MLYGVWHSLVMFFVCFYSLASPAPPGARGHVLSDLASAGTAVFVSLILTVTLKLSLRTRNWNWITFLVYGLSVGLLLPFIYVLGIMWGRAGLDSLADMTGVGSALFAAPAFWLAAVVLAPGLSLLPDLAVAGFSRYLAPSLAVMLQVGWGGGAARVQGRGRGRGWGNGNASVFVCGCVCGCVW